MDDDERKRKLEAGKAKLASFQKKRKSNKKSRKNKSLETDEALKSSNAGDSTAVQTGSDTTDRVLTISDDSDVSTTADEISTEEEASFTGGLSPRERIQELELTVSDQQIALQKLTLENKQLRNKEAELEETLHGRDAVIGELRKNVSQTASHVKNLQEDLSSATESVRASDGDQNEIVSQLRKTRKELKGYVDAIERQEEALKQMAAKLEAKSIEAEEAHELCRSLKTELDKTALTRTLSTDADSAMHILRQELEEQHGHQIALMKKELDRARTEVADLREREEKRFDESQEPSSAMDESDIRALRDQVNLLNIQLEAAFKTADREKRDHDTEVVKLNQKLVSTIGEYEAKLQDEKEIVADLENRLDMSDTVSSEIQSSFSKQLEQLEKDRDELKTQLRESQSIARENASSSKIIEDLEDQLTTYKAEVEETEKRLEQRNKQNRKLQDELDRRKDEIIRQEKENHRLASDISHMNQEIESVKDKVKEQEDEYNVLIEKHASDIKILEAKHMQDIKETISDAKEKAEKQEDLVKEDVRKEMEEKIQQTRNEHSDELKNLHSQHHEQMEELKKAMETNLQSVKDSLEHEKKEQLGTVKEVHERSREREFGELKQAHEEEVSRIHQEQENTIQSLTQDHEKEMDNLKEKLNEERIFEENRIRREMEEDFGSKMQQQQDESKREKDINYENLRAELQDKHSEEIKQLQTQYDAKMEESQQGALSEEKETWEKKLQNLAQDHKKEIEKNETQFEENQTALKEEHKSKLLELENAHTRKMEVREEEMRKLLQEQREEQEAAIQLIKDEALAREQNEKQVAEQMEALQLQLRDATAKLEEEYAEKMSVKESEHLDEKQKLINDCEKLKEVLQQTNSERDGILNQAEESRKKLEALHNEEMLELREQLEHHVQEHKERLKRMQVEMESTRASAESRSQLQELKEELAARNAAVEQVEMLRSEFSDKEQKLLEEHEQLVEKMKQDHETELEELRERFEQHQQHDGVGVMETSQSDLEKELEDYKSKLAAAQANLASLSASSPLRPTSSASDYDTANISAMNKDYRNALTLTHISDVSGIGDELEEGVLHMTTEDEDVMEEGELPTMEEGELTESKESQATEHEKDKDDRKSLSSSSSEDSTHQEPDKEQDTNLDKTDVYNKVEILTAKISELEKQLQNLTVSHEMEMQNLIENHEKQFKETKEESDAQSTEALGKLEEQYSADKEELLQKHADVLKSMEEQKENDTMQLRLKCASETASQIEEELNALREELEKSHKVEIESLKLEMENEMSEKADSMEKRIQQVEKEKNEEIEKLSEDHSNLMEEKISVLMSELYEQKQESLQKLSEEHRNEVTRINKERDDNDEEKKAEFNREVERLKDEVSHAKIEYQKLYASLEAGDNDHIKTLEEQHSKDLENLRIEIELVHDENAKKQMEEFEQAQSEYVNQHQRQLEKFLNEREEENERVEETKLKELAELEEKYKTEIDNLTTKLAEGKLSEQSEIEYKFEEEKRKLNEEHHEELKAVATKLVEIKEERDELVTVRDQLQSHIQQVESEHEQSQAELKAALIAHHMEKFQAAITELDQHHLEEMDKLRQDHDQETEQYKKVAEDLIQKMKDLEEEYKSSVVNLKEDKVSSVASLEQEFQEKFEEEKIDHGSAITSMREAHEAQMTAIQEEHDAQLKLIEEEISNQDRNHRDALDNLLHSQAGKLEELQRQFDIALQATKSEEDERAEFLQGKVSELESQLKTASETQKELENDIKTESESLEQKENETIEERQKQLNEISQTLEEKEEELSAMNSKIEFERAEYESEIDQLQDDISTKDENIKELESELEKNTTALNSLKEKYETVSSRREREGREEDNLLHMLRDDLDRVNDERDQLSNANQQLLSTLTELVQSNHKCEEVISKRLQRLPSGSRVSDSHDLLTSTKSGASALKSEQGASGSDRSGSSSPKHEASTGSFVDEGLDLSQRLAESMFAGPELDTSARDVAVGSGTRLSQAVEKLLDALQGNAQLNSAQQAQIIFDDGSEQDDRSRKKSTAEDTEDDDTSSKSSDADDVKRMEGVFADYMNQKIDLESRIQEQEQDAENLRSDLEKLRTENRKLQNDLSLLQKQKEAFVEGGDESQLSLIKLTEELASEKQALSDQYEASRIHYEKQTQQLELSLEAENSKLDEREREHRIEVDDLNTQIEALQKQVFSNSKFSAEQTSEREIEREQFQQEIDELNGELEKKKEFYRSDSKLAGEVSRLEEEMETRELAHQEQVAKMQEEEERMKKTIQEYEENLQELRGDSEHSELDQVKAQLQDMTTEREVIQQELYDNLLKVSALEARLDQYKHNGEMPGGGAGDQSQVERLRMNLDQEREAHESKDNEIEHLVGVHSQLRCEIIEKEEEIERLLQELESFKQLEAENIKLKDEIADKEDAASVQVTSSRAEELEALSRQLLEEKNAEIDDLQQRLQVLEDNQTKHDSSSESSDEEKEDSTLQTLQEENLHLQKQIQEMQHIKDLEADASEVKIDIDADVIKQENIELKNEIEGLKIALEQSSIDTSPPVLGVTQETKEKIRHLEELLEKENEDVTESENQPVIIQEKLQEVANELKSQPDTIIGRILNEKDEKIDEQDQKIQKAEKDIAEKREDVEKLQEKISTLERDLSEPDVKVQMKKGKAVKGKEGEEKDVQVEKDSLSSSSTVEDDESSASSTEGELDLSQDEDVCDGQPSAEDEKKSINELKILLDQQEKDLKDKDEVIENNLNVLSEKQEECKELLNKLQEMENKCDEVQKELEQRLQATEQTQSDESLTEEDYLKAPAVQTALAKATESLEEALKQAEKEATISKEEKERLTSDLGDVQREYMALLGESQDLSEMQENQTVLQDKIKDLESLVAERESEFQQAQQENDEMQEKMNQLKQDIEVLKQQEETSDKDEKITELQNTLESKLDGYNRLLQELQQKEEIVEALEQQLETSNQQSKAHHDEIELLQNEQQILNSENERLHGQTQEINARVEDLETVVSEMKQEIVNKEKEIQVIKKERFIEPESAMLFEEGSLEEEDVGRASSEEESQTIEQISKTHEAQMEEMKNKYSQALTRVVEDTKKQLQDDHEKKMKEIQDKHRREVAEILSESFSAESELAKKLREELDLADQLDHNLMGHLATNQTSEDPDEAEISSKLQALLDRIHNEGVQVLSLSELQFLKQHQRQLASTPSNTPPPPTTVEEAQQTSLKLEDDMAKLRKSWESEKLALLNAIQALKELVAHTNADDSHDAMPDGEDSRGDLLRVISDVFEKERDALIAELQTTVLEASQDSRDEPTYDQSTQNAIDKKLQALENKLKHQGSQHTAALERLMTIDRDSLLDEIRDLRNDRKQNLKQAEDRIRHLEGQLSNNDYSNNQNMQMLQSQVERLEYKLQQERALAADIKSSLEAERVRATDHLPALQRERDRSVELDNEIGRLQRRLADDAEATRSRTESLQVEADESRHHLEDLQNKLAEARIKLSEAEKEAAQIKHDNAQAKSEGSRTIQDLKHALNSEENRRDNLTKALEAERNNVAQLHEELATLRADAHQEIGTQKIRLAELEDMVASEQRKCDDLNCALKREEDTGERLRQTLEDERALAKDARQHDRATVTDLQRILDDAKTETERVQKKMDAAERDARIAKQQLDDVQSLHHDAIESERAAREQLQSDLERIQEQKQEVEMKLHNLEDNMRRQNLSNLITNAGVPASPSNTEGLLANRRQLESMRQRLQMESTKLQDLMSKTAQRLPHTVPTDSFNQPQDAARQLASEIEQVDSVKRSLAEMQQELREMYSSLSMPQRECSRNTSGSSDFNDRLMEQNAELVQLNTRHTDEKMALRDALRRLEEEVWKARADSEDNKSIEDNKQQQQQVQEMASRMHRLYVRYLRAESFRKALVYQKKYLLLLIGGFQDCEEATLALVARMGAYPSDDANRSTHRSPAFKKFRSAVRVVMAVSRLKFLVRKWSRTSSSISASIKEKHGATPLVNGHHQAHPQHRRPSRSVSPNLRPISSTSAHTLGEKSPSPTPLPQYGRQAYETPVSYEPYRQTLRAAAQHMDTPPTKLSAATPYSTSGARPRTAYTRSTTSPYLNSYGDQPSATALRYLNGNDRPGSRHRPRSYHSDFRTPDQSSSYNRTQPGESDPSLNDYIQKLENLQHRLEQNPHRYQR